MEYSKEVKDTEERINMSIANCRICTLTPSHCADCPLNWALKLIENSLKVIEIEVSVNFIEIPISAIELSK